MDAFEALIADLLVADAFWVLPRYRVRLTKPEKVAIGRPSTPRWELDIVAYQPQANQLLAVECKSYLDSKGVDHCDVVGSGKHAGRYKLFTEPETRRVVLGRLVLDLVASGMVLPNPTVKLALAAGRIRRDEAELAACFESNGWQLYGPSWIRERVQRLAEGDYDNSTAAVVSKLLLREPGVRTPRAGNAR